MKVLLIEDSASVRAYIEGVLQQAPDIEVLPSARDGAEGVHAVLRHRPDLVLMDIELPVLDGISAIVQIMELAPCPVVVLSAYLDTPGHDRTFDALEAGAVDVLAKPSGLTKEAIERFAHKLLSTVRLMAQAHVVRRSASSIRKREERPKEQNASLSLVAIGASTGGPAAIREILRRVKAKSPVPIVIAQHTIPGFEHGLADWLSGTGHRVLVANGHARLEPGIVYLAPADQNVVIAEGSLEVVPAEADEQVPSADLLFHSAARIFGDTAVGVLLTGMGDDGARGLLSLYERGALTMTQSAASCVVNGMPEAARRLGASVLELSPAEIASLLDAKLARM